MKYPVVKSETAREWWFQWRHECAQAQERVAPPPVSAVTEKECTGPDGFTDAILDVIARLSALYDSVDGKNSNLTSNRFESEAAVTMHQNIPECEALGDPEFWVWCAVKAGPELIARRYPLSSTDKEQLCMGEDSTNDSPGPAEPGRKKADWIPGKQNFFSASARESLFYRLWIRGRLGCFPDEPEPYALARCGDVDFWRSHIFRQQSLEAEALRAEFIRFQFPDGPNEKPRLSQNKIRALIKRMRRAAANVVVDGLDREQSREFIERQWREMGG